MARLAGPVVVSELGWMLMGIVDTMMVGRVSAEALGGVSIGGALFATAAIIGLGLLLGLDTLVSQAFGAGDVRDCHRSLVSSLYIALPLAPILMVLLRLFEVLLHGWGIQPAVLREVIPYLRAVTWSLVPQFLFFALRRYLQGMNLVWPVMFALLSANLVNVAANWVLIFGHLGAPAMGAAGAGWATTLSRIYMTGFLIAYMFYYDRRERTGLRETPLRPDRDRIRRLIRLGAPAAAQLGLEVSVFATATTLIGRLDAVSLAAHQIALNLASFTFMVPLGVSSAAAVRVGQALGRGDPAGAARSGWAAITLGGAFMACAGLCFLAAPEFIAGLFTADAAVRQAGAVLLLVAAAFQLFDGIQVSATGALRGAGDTRTPMIWHLAAYWLVGLPAGYALCFRAGWGAAGIWTGLCIALILIGIVLLAAWARRVRALQQQHSLEAVPAGGPRRR